MSLFKKDFWILSAERAAKTFAQSFVTIVSADQVAGFFDASLGEAALSALFATGLSFLTSVASIKSGSAGTPSLVASAQENVVLEKIESGEPVGSPARVVEVTEESFVEEDDAVGSLNEKDAVGEL